MTEVEPSRYIFSGGFDLKLFLERVDILHNKNH